MGLAKTYTLAVNRLPELFAKIRDGQAPTQFSQQLLKDWGFSSSNDRVMLPMLKELGFLSPDGKPTKRYHAYRDQSRSQAVMADALREAYADLFLIKEHPGEGDKKAIQGKFKSFHNVSDLVASNMMKSFYALLKLSDLKASNVGKNHSGAEPAEASDATSDEMMDMEEPPKKPRRIAAAGLHYNIQIHLPASKDVEVYNAIFKSLRDHLLEE